MSETLQIEATGRDVIGKANRRLAGQNVVPAVVYGEGREPQAISLDRHAMELELSRGGHASLYKLAIDGDKAIDVVVRSIQRHVTRGSLQHVDFLAVSADKLVSVTVTVNITGSAAGVKEGGILTVDAHEIHIEAKPADLPESIEADISSLEIGSALFVSDLVAPPGVTILEDPEKAVCSVVAPAAIVEEESELAEGAEPVEGEVPEVGEEKAGAAAEEE